MLTIKRKSMHALGLALLASTAIAGSASAAQINITVTNNSAVGGLFLTPLLSVFHDGNFNTFNVNEAASAGLEALAEDGNFVPERDRAEGLGFNTAVHFGTEGFGSTAPQPPLLDTGESVTLTVDLDPTTDLYYSFLSMILPSNDNFIGNGNPFAYELFENGVFTDLADIQVFGGDVWDAGTEFNDLNGAPFVVGASPVATDTDGVVTSAFDFKTGDSLDFINGTNTPVGSIFGVQGATDLLATISFSQVAPVPLPAALPMLLAGMGFMGVVGRRRRKSA